MSAEQKIIDLDLSATRKQKIRIDGDDNRILEINTSDLEIFPRINEIYPKLLNLITKVSEQRENLENVAEDSEAMEKAANLIKNIDKEMRTYMDQIFDSNVSEVCCPSGTMYDPFNGQFRFEIIMEKLLTLYDNNIQTQYKKFSQRIKKHTDKYTSAKLPKKV